VGRRADINVIDYDNMRLHIPEVRYDLPKQGRRLVQRVDGYRHTMVAGIETFADGVYTGATPGRLVRAGSR
jgi:N-acyl-D-aspartate/D-glutamate deacylase